MCVISLKGACYFACALHISDGLFLLWTFIFDIIHVNKLWWYAPLAVAGDDPNLTWFFVMIGVYIVGAIFLGCFIFRGIETEDVRLMFGGGVGFLILQVVAFITSVCWWYPIPPTEDPFGLLESARIGRFVTRSLATIAYIGLLGLYVRRLRVRLLEDHRPAVYFGGYNNNNNNRKPRGGAV